VRNSEMRNKEFIKIIKNKENREKEEEKKMN
jgi:hypothetical protein